MKKEIGVAILGCGYWGVNYIRIFSEISGVRVVTVCDTRQERLAEIKERFSNTSFTTTTNVDDILNIDEVDAVVICTTAATHYEIASKCLKAGKHILIEKPLATTVEDAQALVALADSHHVTLMVGHTFLYHAGIQKIKEIIRQDDMEQIYYLYSRRTNLGPIRHDVNAIWDLAPHDVSIFNYLLDKTPTWVSAVGTNVLGNVREDVGFVSLGYGDNIIGNIHVSWADPNKVRELVVVGSNQRIVFDDLNAMERVKIFEKGVTRHPAEAATYGEFQFMIRDGDILSPRIEVSEPLKNQCMHFLDCLRKGQVPITDGRTGVSIIQVLTAIEHSVAQNGAPVTISPPSAAFAYTSNGQNGKSAHMILEKSR